MERLTEQKRNSDGTGISKQSLIDRPGKGYPNLYCKKILTKLAEYEDLEEQCIKENTWGLRILLKKWKEFFEDIQEFYEDKKLKKQGRLLEFPCTVGDRIYRIDTDEKLENREVEIYEIDNIVILANGTILLKYDAYDGVICELENIVTNKPYLDFYRCFLTKEEAEQALKGQEGSREKTNEEICEKVKKLCKEERVDFLFITEGKSCWSVSHDKHIRQVARFHKENEPNSK